jgi:hypothetical protein
MPNSKISRSTYVVNIPEVTNFSSDFVYNFYTIKERTESINDINSQLSPRYVALSWNPLSRSENYDYVDGNESTAALINSIVSEDDTFSRFYYSRNFSEVTDIQKAAVDLDVYFGLNFVNDFFDISNKNALLKIIANSDTFTKKKSAIDEKIKGIYDQYDALSDLPTQVLGLQVVDAQGIIVDKGNLFKTLTSSLSLNVKINKLVAQDVLSNAEIGNEELEQLKKLIPSIDESKDVILPASELKNINTGTGTTPRPRIKGYIIRRYRYDSDGGLTEEFVKYLKNSSLSSYNDSGVVYGGKYVYTLNVVAEIDILGDSDNDGKVDILTVKIASRSVLTDVSCYEFKPPPPPADIKFNFDYVKKNVIITWDFPVNPQSDIKQFQVFRRAILDQPFELIAQYGFDRSTTSFEAKSKLSSELGLNAADSDQTSGNFANRRFVTGEIVDANNISSMSSEFKHLVKDSDLPIYKHVDVDFVIDNEFFESTSYIYAICSVDAHGMISNYSSQYKVNFDFYKNRLISQLICDEGAPRTYPNMNLRSDTFKDSINTTGMKIKSLDIYFSPDHYEVIDESGTNFKVVNIQLPDKQQQIEKPFYQMQIINLDNQKMKVLKMNIEQPPPPADIITILVAPPAEIEVLDFLQVAEEN